MEKNRIVLLLLHFAIILTSCTSNSKTEKYQDRKNNIGDVHDQGKEILIPEDKTMIGAINRLFLLDKYLIIADYRSQDMLICILNKDNNFEHVMNAVPRGQGPGEITNMGYIATNEDKREFYLSDHGKLKIFSYKIDSIFSNPLYTPDIKKEINKIQFPSEYEFVNDTLSFARIIVPTGNSGYNEFIAKWNMQTDNITPIKYTHPKIKKKRIALAVSIENDKYIECYHNHDLITILDLNGNLMCNIYGNSWKNGEQDQLYHFGGVVFCENKIVASYSGGDRLSKDYLPTKFIIFDLEGYYLKTIETGYHISDFCYDKENKRLIMSLDDDIQFAYLDLKELLD